MDLALELARSDPNNSELLRVGYDRMLLKPRLAHIGVGGFHRSHLAVYCDELAELGSDWIGSIRD